MARRGSSGRGSGWLRWLIGGVVVVLVIVIALVVAASALVPVDTIRDRIVAEVKNSTGRDLSIKGGFSVSVFPSLTVTAKDVTFSNAPWAGNTPMVSLAKLDLKLRLPPLISGRVEIASFVLDKPVFDLQTDKTGRGNWEFAAPVPAAATPTPADKSAAPQAPASGTTTADSGAKAGSGGGALGAVGEIALGDVRISNGHVAYRDGVTGKTDSADAIDLKVSLPNLDSPLALDGSLTWHDKPVRLTIGAAKPRALMDGSGSPIAIKLGADTIKLTFNGTMGVAGSPKGAGDVDLAVPSVRKLMAWATGRAPTMPGDGLGPFSIKGKVSVAGATYGLTGIQIALDTTKGTGDLAVDTGGARPSIKGTLAIDKLDLNHYMAPAKSNGSSGKDKAVAPSPAKAKATGATTTAATPAGGWSDDPIDASGMKAADVSLALAADAILYRKVEIGKSAARIALDAGRLTLDLTDIALYQGHVKGKVRVDGTAVQLVTDADLKVDKVQVQPLMKAFADNDRVSGAAVLDTQLTSKGRSQRELIGALGGKGQLALLNGVVRGVDLVGLVKDAAASAVGGKDGETAFTTAKGSYTIANGILSNRDLTVSAPTLSATGSGTVDLPRRTVDYKLVTQVAGTLAVPVNVKGPWDNIGWNVDMAGILKDNAANAGKLLTGGAKGVGGVLGTVGKKLFGN